MKTIHILLLIVLVAISASGYAKTETVHLDGYTFEKATFDELQSSGGVFSSEIPEWVQARRVFSDVKRTWVLSSDHIVITTMEKIGGLSFVIDVGIWRFAEGKIVFFLGSPIDMDKPARVYEVIRVWSGREKGSVILVAESVLHEATSAREIWVNSVAFVATEKPIDRVALIAATLEKLE